MELKDRVNQLTMNLVISYTRDDDLKLEECGFKFIGAAYDKELGEVHIFELKDLETFKKIKKL